MVKPLLLAAALATSGQLADSPLSPSGLTGVQLAALLGGLPGALPTASDLADDILPRSGQIGVQPAAPPAGEAGALIQQVLPDSTAARLGIEAGDRIVSIDGNAINDVPALFEAAGKLTANDPITISFVRAGETRSARGEVAPRPPEEPVVGRVRYDQIEHAGGRLRVLVNAPYDAGPYPTVFYLQGYPCQSVESPNPNGVTRRIVQEFVAAGFAVVRVEKPGMGDSDGPANCTEIDFATELGAFAAGWRYAAELPESRDDALFMVGISMGGVQAPLVAAAAEHPPRGIVVWGTRVTNWHEYMLELVGVQPVLLGTGDPVAAFHRTEAVRPVLARFFLDQTPLDALLDEAPEAQATLADVGLGPDGRMFGRNPRFFQQLAALDLATAWRDAPGAVLSLYGESDITAIDGGDQALIASIVNYYRPGTATFEVVPETNHGMRLVGDRDAYRRLFASGASPNLTPLNEAVPERMVSFAQDVLAASDS